MRVVLCEASGGCTRTFMRIEVAGGMPGCSAATSNFAASSPVGLGIVGGEVSAAIGEFQPGAFTDDFDVAIESVALVVRGGIRQGVVMQALFDALADLSCQVIAARERATSGLMGEVIHGTPRIPVADSFGPFFGTRYNGGRVATRTNGDVLRSEPNGGQTFYIHWIDGDL